MSQTQQQDTGSALRDQAESVSETVQTQAVEIKDKGREQLRSQLDQRTTDVGRQAKGFADVLRQSGNQAQAQNGGQATARITSGVADRIERAGGYLESARGDDMLRDAERFARERPWVVAGVAAAAGFAASRFLKASSERRYGSGAHQSWDRYSDPAASSRYQSPSTVPVGAGTSSPYAQ